MKVNARTEYVYFVQARISGQLVGPIKIGKAIEPRKRLSSLQTGSPVPLEMLTVTDIAPEAKFHHSFWRQRLHGEWFRATPQLLACVEAIKTGTFRHSDLNTIHPATENDAEIPLERNAEAAFWQSRAKKLEALLAGVVDVVAAARSSLSRAAESLPDIESL